MSFIEEYGLVKYNPKRSTQYPKSVPCERCNKTHTYYNKPLRMVFDHCHDHGWIRGILCQQCNLAMVDIEQHIYFPKPKNKLEKSLYEMRLELIKFYDRCPDCPPWEPYITQREYKYKTVISKIVWMQTDKYKSLSNRQKAIFKSNLLFHSYSVLGLINPFERSLEYYRSID